MNCQTRKTRHTNHRPRFVQTAGCRKKGFFFRFAILALLVVGMTALQSQTPVAIPLAFQTVSGQERLVIYAGINGSAALPYLFDTGSAIFNASYYNGAYTGPGTNPTAWTYSSTISTGATYAYSNFHYTLNAVTVQSIQIYNSSNLLTPAISLNATDVNPGSTGFTIGQVTDNSMTYSNGASFQSNLAQGIAPFTNASNSPFYGTFGAGIFSTTNNTGSASFQTGSVLGQATTTGWSVIANDASPFAILGLDEGIRTQFASSMNWTADGPNPFPNSGANSGTEFGAGAFAMTLSGTGDAIPWTNTGVLLDTGTADNMLNATGVDPSHLDRYYVSGDPGKLDAGNQLAMTGLNPGNGTYSFTITDASNPITYNATVEGAAAHSTIGINFFLNNSVAFDLENKKTFYTPNAVTVPEPNTSALLFALIGGYLLWKALLCRQPNRP